MLLLQLRLPLLRLPLLVLLLLLPLSSLCFFLLLYPFGLLQQKVTVDEGVQAGGVEGAAGTVDQAGNAVFCSLRLEDITLP